MPREKPEKIIDGKQIRTLTPQSLTYLTDAGNEEIIDFAVCYANYLRKTTSPEYIEGMKELNPQSRWDEEGVRNYIERRRKWKEIGSRQVLTPPWDDGLYIEFHTEPPIRLKFDTVEGYRNVL